MHNRAESVLDDLIANVNEAMAIRWRNEITTTELKDSLERLKEGAIKDLIRAFEEEEQQAKKW